MENALDFVFEQGSIHWCISYSGGNAMLTVFNTGPHIPDYALERITERFYSLPRENGVKSTGLGLNFVEQVAKLHSGTLEIANVEGGVKVALQLPTP